MIIVWVQFFFLDIFSHLGKAIYSIPFCTSLMITDIAIVVWRLERSLLDNEYFRWMSPYKSDWFLPVWQKQEVTLQGVHRVHHHQDQQQQESRWSTLLYDSQNSLGCRWWVLSTEMTQVMSDGDQMAKCKIWSLHLIGWWASDIFLVVVPFWLFSGGIELMMKTWRRISEPIIKMVIREGIMKKAMMKVLIMMTLGQNYNDNDSDKGEC